MVGKRLKFRSVGIGIGQKGKALHGKWEWAPRFLMNSLRISNLT